MNKATAVKSLIYYLFIALTLVSPLSAQIDWTADFVFDPYPSPYLSDWEANGNIGSVLITNNTTETIEIIIYLTLSESGRGQIATANSNIISFPPGSAENISTNDIVDYESLDYNTDLEELIIRTGRLPEGEYTACLEIQKSDGVVILSNICVSFTIVYPDPPYLIFPFDGDTLVDLFPIFQWTPVQVPVTFPVHYQLKIVETYDGQVPYHALQANPVHYEELYLTETNLQYPLDALELIKGKRYAWQVQVLDETNYPPSTNDGRSEVWSFFYDPDTTTPPEMYTISGTVRSLETKQGIAGAEILFQPVKMRLNGSDTSWAPSGKHSISVTASQGGAFLFDECEEGQYFQIVVAAEDYREKIIRGVEYYLRGDMAGLNIELEVTPPGNRTLSGKAVDFFTNKPLANHTIIYHQVVKSSESFVELPLKKLEVQTDAEGSFKFTQTADSSYFSLSTGETATHLARTEVGNHYYQAGDLDSLLFLIRPKAGAIEGFVTSLLGDDTIVVSDAKVTITKICTAIVEETTEVSSALFPGLIIDRSVERRSITQSSGQGISVQTDERGYFKCENIQPEFTVNLNPNDSRNSFVTRETSRKLLSISEKKLTIKVTHPKYENYVSPDSITFVMGEVTDAGTHQLSPRVGSVSGHIAKAEGNVEGAVVRVFRQEDYLAGSISASSDSGAWGGGSEVDALKALSFGRSNASGRYMITDIPINDPSQESDHYILEVTADGYYKKISELRLTRQGENLTKDFTLADKPSIVSGQVARFSGDGVSGARVVLTNVLHLKSSLTAEEQKANTPVRLTFADGSGNFSFIGVPKGTYRVAAATPNNIVTISDSFYVAGGRTISLPIVIKEEYGTLAGVVNSSNGDPLPNVVIKSITLPSLYVTTNIKGEFTLKKVPVGEMGLTLTHYNHHDTAVSVEVPPDAPESEDPLAEVEEPEPVEIVMERLSGTYQVLVLDLSTEEKLANIEVTLGEKSKTTNSSGLVTFKDIGVGSQELTVAPPKADTYDKDYVPFSTKVTVKVGLNGLKTIKLIPGARMSGKVVALADSKEIGSVSIKIDGNDKIKTTTDENGNFILKNLPVDDPITLVAQKPGYRVTRLSKDWSIKAGDHIQGVIIKMEESPVDSLFGFAIVLDSITNATGSNKYLTGSLIQIKNSFGLSFNDEDPELRFERVLVDENYKPVKDSFNLEATELDVTVFGFEGNMQNGDGLKVEWIDSLEVGRISGEITIMDASSLFFPETKLGKMKIPKKNTPTFWSDGVNRSLQKFGLTATDTEIQATFKGVQLAVDYTKTNIDSTGLHFYGSIAFKEKFKLGFENLHLANENGAVELKGITIVTDPVPKIPFGVFTVYDSSATWDETGFWLSGSLQMNKLSNREFGIKDVHVSKNGDFLSATVTADDKNSEIEVHGQKFAIEEISFGTDNWDVDTLPNIQYLMLSGALTLTGLDKPVEFQNLKYTETDVFTGTIAFNQTKTFKNIVSLSLEEITFDVDSTDRKFVAVSGGVKFGAIKGVKAEASNLQFYYDGTVDVDEIGLGFFAGPTEVEIRVRWTDIEFEGEGLLQIKPIITAGAEFRYAGTNDWWVRVVSGTRIPVGPAEIVDATGGVGLKNDTWRFMIGGTIAPKKADKGISMAVEVNVYLKPAGVILTGSADVEVASSIHAGHGEFKFDIPRERIDGSIIYTYDNDALAMNGQINFGVQFGKYWFIHGTADVNFLEFFSARGLVIAANNWPYYYNGQSRIIRGIIVDISRDFYKSGDYGVIGWGLGIHQHAALDVSWAGNFSGEIEMSGNAHAYVGFDPFGTLKATGSFDVGAGLKKSGSVWSANGYGKFTLAASAGNCNASCNSICSGCAERVWGVCVWPKLGGKVCVGMQATVNYSSSTGTDLSIKF